MLGSDSGIRNLYYHLFAISIYFYSVRSFLSIPSIVSFYHFARTSLVQLYEKQTSTDSD